MADDIMKKELIAHKIYSAWQFITYTEKNINTVQYCADTIDKVIGNMAMMSIPGSVTPLSGFWETAVPVNWKPAIRQWKPKA